MGKPLSEKERQLQKKLIPLNIFVCILCVVAMVSLLIMPILKVDIGKILRSEQTMEMVGEMLGGQADDSTQDVTEDGVSYTPVVKEVVKNVFGSAEASVSFSGIGASKVFFAPKEQKAAKALEVLLTGDGAFVDNLIDSIVEGVGKMFSGEEGKQNLEKVVITTLVSGICENIEGEKIPVETALALVEKFGAISSVTDGDTTSVSDGIIEELEKSYTLSSAEKQKIAAEVQLLYDNTKAETGEGAVTAEAVICVSVSRNADLDSFNLANILQMITGGSSEGGQEEGARSARASDGVVTTYSELIAKMGLNESAAEAVKTQLKESLTSMMTGEGSIITAVFNNYGWMFIGVLGFMLPWLVLFLFAFIRIFTKNKRFMMWYVKLTGFIPPLVFLAILFGPGIISAFVPEAPAVISLLLGGMSSMTWIVGICYILLWFASILWAFPIKHKIRKERKLMKSLIKSGAMPSDTAISDSYGLGSPDYGSDYGYGSDLDGYGGYDHYDPDGFDEIIDSYGLGSDYDLGSGYGGYSSLDDDEDDDY